MYDFLIQPLVEFAFMRSALAVVVVVGVTTSVLSCLLVVRRQALLGDAISHAVLLGVVLGWLAGRQVGIFLGALTAGILAGLAITFVERNSRVKLDAAMGILFTFMFALGLVIISVVRPKGIDLYGILLGNVLGAGALDLWLTAVSGVLVVAMIVFFFRGFHVWSFDPVMARVSGMPVSLFQYTFTALLSAAIVAALQAVGIILVVAMLITPGAAAYLLTDRLSRMMWLATGFGVFSCVTGLYGSYYLDVPSGPSIVVVVSLIFCLAFVFAPQRGVIARQLAQGTARRQRIDDDVLRAVVMSVAEEGIQPGAVDIAMQVGRSDHEVEQSLGKLVRRGLVSENGERFLATEAGNEQGISLVRKHRLLERYLFDEEHVPMHKLHTEADRMEHGVTDDYLLMIDQQLGNPRVDPHGHVIPSDLNELKQIAGQSLSVMEPGEAGRISLVRDDRDDLLRAMVDLDLLPDRLVTAMGESAEGIRVRIREKEVTVSKDLAERIFVTPAPAQG